MNCICTIPVHTIPRACKIWRSNWSILGPHHINMPSSHASIDDLSSESSYDSDEEYYLAQKEWEESLHQLEQIVSIVLLPVLGKWLGRRWSYWGSGLRFLWTHQLISICSLRSLSSFGSWKGVCLCKVVKLRYSISLAS